MAENDQYRNFFFFRTINLYCFEYYKFLEVLQVTPGQLKKKQKTKKQKV